MHKFFFNEDEEQNENLLEVPIEKKEEEVYIVPEPFDPDKKTLTDVIFESINEIADDLNDLKNEHIALNGRVDKIDMKLDTHIKSLTGLQRWWREECKAANEAYKAELAAEGRRNAFFRQQAKFWYDHDPLPAGQQHTYDK